MEKINYYLVLERRLGDYHLVDINHLDICNHYVENDIATIDYFTGGFTEAEIKGSIERSNMAPASYLEGTLKIISDAKHKHNLRVLTKDIYINVMAFSKSFEALDQDYKNKLYGAYKKIVEHTFEDVTFIKGMLDRFKISLKSSNVEEIFNIILELPYAKSRAIYFAIYDENTRRSNEKLRKLEKLDDAV